MELDQLRKITDGLKPYQVEPVNGGYVVFAPRRAGKSWYNLALQILRAKKISDPRKRRRVLRKLGQISQPYLANICKREARNG